MKKFDSLKTLTRMLQSFVAVMLVTLIAVGNVAAEKQWQKVTNVNQLSVGDSVVIVSASADLFALGTTQNSNNRAAVAYTIDENGFLQLTSNIQVIELREGTVDGSFAFYTGSAGYLYAASSSSNYLRTQTSLTANSSWNITMTETGEATVIAQGTYTRNNMRFNNSSTIFACYAASSNQPKVSFYKLADLPPAAVATPVFTPSTGTYYAAQTVTITCATEGATIHYTLDGTTPTATSPIYTTALTLDTATTLKAIAIKNDDASYSATAIYSFPEFTVLNNLAAFKRQTSATTLFHVNSNMTVIYQTEDKFHTFVQDDSAAIYIYGTMDKAYQAGDVINGGVFGKYSLYYTMNEMKPEAGAPLAAGVAGTPVAPIEVTVSELYRNYDLYEGKLVTVKGVSINTNFTFTTSSANGVDATGDTIFNIRNTFKTLSMSVVANDVADVTGLVTRYNNKIQIAPRDNQDIVIPVATLPYTVDFDQNVDEFLNINNGTAINKWFVGTAEGFDNNKLYISSSNGVTNKYDCSSAAQVTASRELIIPENGATLSFDVRVNGEANNDMLWVVLYNYTNDVINNTANWSVGIYDEPEWTNVKAVISPEHAGKARLVFYWVNNNNGIGEQYPAAIDNISITEATCAQPTELAVTVSTDTAVVTWNTVDSTQNAWTLEYKLEDHSEWYTVNADTTNVTLTGLQGNSNYNVRVKANCGSESSEWTFGAFNVPCLNMVDGVCQDGLACATPDSVTVSNITPETATISWTGNAANYSFEYKTGENDWTVVSVNTNTYTLTNLTQKTDYLVRVKAICGENNYSLYSVEVPFTTTSVCPVVTNVTSSNLSTTTTVSWTPGGEENAWTVRFRPVGTTEWVELPRISGIASTTFGGLLNQADYEVEIKALCNPDDEDNQSSWVRYEFISGCAPFTLEEATENFNATVRPNCWDDNNITFNGTAAVADTAAQWLMTPPVQIPADYNTYVVVDMQGEATLMASYRGTAMDRFAEVSVLANDSTGHYIVEIPAAYKNKAINFMFMATGEFSIDNVEFTQCPFVPSNLVAANPLNHSVELSWTGVNNNGWKLEYAKSNTNEWTALTLDQTSSDTVEYTLTGLEGDQAYKFRVSTICEGGSISNPSNVATIQTRCDAVAVPYKDFTSSQYGSNYNGTLHCWTPFYTGRDSQSGASVSASGQLLLKKYYHVTDAPSGDVFAILPTMDTALNTLQISFNIKTNNGTPNQKVYLCLVTDVNNPADSFKILKDYTATSNEESYFYTLDGVEREGNLAFRMPLEDAHSHEVLINNVVVEVIPPCQAPFNLVANALDENRVQLTWEYVEDEGGDNDFTIRYKKRTSSIDNFPEPYEGGTEKLGASTPREFNDLEYGATYKFVIRHECGDMHSAWSKEYLYTFVKNYNIAKETNITTCHGTVVYQDTTTAATTKTMVINPSNTTSWVKLTGDVQLDGCTLYVYEGNAVAANKLLKTYTGNVSDIALTPVCENEITLRLVKKANSNPVLNLQIECEAAPTCSAPTQLAYNELTTALTWTAGCWGAAESYNIQVLNGDLVLISTLTSTTTNTNIPVETLGNGKYILRIQPVCDNVPGEWSDTISFERVACADPTAFTVNMVSTANGYTAQLTWSGNAAVGYEVGYKLHDAYSWATANVNANTHTYTTPVLDDNVKYDFRVKAICSAADESGYVTRTEHVNCVTEVPGNVEAQIGNGTSTDNNFPFRRFWYNSYLQQLFTQEELEAQGIEAGMTISGLAFNYFSSTATDVPLRLSLANTNVSSLSSFVSNNEFTEVFATDWVNFNNSDNSWYTIQFTTPFVYEGGNLVVATLKNYKERNTSHWTYGSGSYFYCTSASGKARYCYNDNTGDAYQITFNANGMPMFNSSVQSGYTASYRNNVIFVASGMVCQPVVSCPAPSNVAMANLGPDSVTVNWDKGGNETAWTVVYKLNNGAEVSATATDTFYTITGLEPSTAYSLNFHVYANCDANHQSEGASKTFSFTTPCLPMANLPYTWDFESNNTSGTTSYPLPECWSRITGSYPYVYNDSYGYGYTHSGTKCLYSYGSGTSNIAVLSPIDLVANPLNTLKLSFFARASYYYSYYTYKVLVGVMSNPSDASTFETVATFPITSATYNEFSMAFNHYTGQGKYLAMKIVTPSSYSIYVDDVTLDFIPTCGVPEVQISGNDAIITPDVYSMNRPVSYELAIGGEVRTIDSATHRVGLDTLFGLQPLTEYTLTVKAICGVGDTSAENTITFTTPAIPASLPYSHSFDNTTENGQWTIVNGTCTNKWFIGNATGNGDNTALYISNDNGTSNAYTNNAPTVVWAFRDFNFERAGTYYLNFDWMCYGESTYDYMRVFFGDLQTVVANTSGTIQEPTGVTNLINPTPYSSTYPTYFNYQSSWQNYSTPITIPTPGVKRLYFCWLDDTSAGNDPPAAVDNISIQMPVTCSVPTIIGINSDTVLSWTAGSTGTPASYTLEYGINGSETLTSVTVTDTFYAFHNLTLGATYAYRLKVNCGAADGESQWTPYKYFRIPYPCQAQYELPFVEDFEETSQTRDCWMIADIDRDGYNWTLNNYSAYAHSGDYFYASPSYYDGSELSSDNVLLSPAIHISTPAQLSFWASSLGNWLDHFSVYIDTALQTLFNTTPLLDSVEAPNGYTEYVFNLDAYIGKTIYIAFRHQDYNQNWLLLDDISITTHPSCSAPMALAFEDDTLIWNKGVFGTPASYNVRYRLQGDTVWTTATVDTNFYAPARWEPNSDYEAQVQTNCGNEDLSEWCEIINFHTPVVCFTPTNLAVSDVTYYSANVSWTDSHAHNNYAIEYKAEGDTTWTTVAGDSTLKVTLTNLNYLTTYTVRIKSVCSELDESEYSEEVEFTTLCAGGYKGEVDFSFANSSSWSYLPFYGLYGYTYSQQIYDASELNTGEAEITSISFKCSTAPSADKTGGIHIWLGQTDKSTFANNTDYVDVSTLTEVFAMPETEGYQYVAGEWNTFTFDTPFHYDGTSNLVVAYYEGKDDYNSGAFYCHTTTDNKSILHYSDTKSNVSYTNPATASGTKRFDKYRNDILLGVGVCPPDNDLAVDSIAPIEDNCDLSNAKVTIRVKNNSFLNAVNGFTATLALNDTADVVTETVNATIAPQDSYTFTFAHVPAYTDGSNNIKVTVTAADDEVEDNNVITLNDIRQVVPATVPYDQTFSNVDLTRDAWKQGTENNNPNLWKNNNGVLTFVDNDTIDAQNYVITHCIEIPAEQVQVSYDYNALSNLPENLKVYMGTTPDINTMTLIGSHEGFTKADEDYTFNYLFNNENAGVYYFAIEALSTKGNMGVTFDNLKIMPMIDVMVSIRPDSHGEDNGIVRPQVGINKVPYNGSLTINMIPNEMYHVAGVWVDSVQVVNEDPYNASFMMYTLDNITEAHTIEVQYKMEFHIFKYVYNYNDQYAEVGGQIVGKPIDTTIIPSGGLVQFTADEHYTLYSMVMGNQPPASEGAIIDGENVTADVTYDEATRTYSYIIDTMYVANYYVQACFKRDTVAINYATLTGEGVYDGVNTHAGETHITYVDYGTDFTSSILPAEGYYTMNVTVNGVDTGIIDHYDFDSVITEQYVTAQFGHKVTASIMNINNNEYLGSDEVRGTIAPAEQMILSGSSCSVAGNVQEHFHLSNFFVNGVDKLADVTIDGLNFSYTIDSLVANTDIVAVVRIDSIAIYYTVDGGNGYVNGNLMEAPALDTLYLEYGSDFMSNFAAATGYHIVNVTVNGTAYNEIPQWLTEYITEAQYITVTFALNEYDITTTAHGNGSVSDGVHVVYDPESSYTFTATPAVGSHISQILRNNEALEISDPEATYTETISPVLSDYNYVAFFAANIYTVTASCGENGTIDPYGAQSFEYGETPTFTVTPNAGYAIEHVYVDGEEVELTNNAYTFAALTANHTISATFTADNYTITATAGNNGSIDPDGENVVMAGSTVVYTITPATGYEIEDVTVDGQSVGAVSTYTFENVAANHTIAATFSALQFTITATAGANGTINPSGVQTVTYGATPTFTVAANPGYDIDYVLVDGQNVTLTNGAYTFDTVKANHEIFAAFKIKTYTITVTDPANGTITPNGTITVNHGATPTFTVTPATGYDVTAITVNGNNVIANATATVMGAYTYTFPAVTANRTLTATMTKKQFTITATAGDHGTITGPATVNYGDNATYTIAASEGYEIEDVTVDGMHVGAVATYTFHNVTANHTIHATFKVEPCVVPTNLRTINIDSTSATLVWYHPGADSYDIQYKVSTANTWTLVSNVPGFAYDLTNLQSATNYVWKIKANTVGCTDNDWSNATSFTTLAGPSSPDGINDYVKNHVNVYAEHNRVHIINDYNVDINNVAIYDMYGKLIYSGNAISNPEVIELNVAVGTYVVRLNTQQGPAVYKVHINR